MSTAAKKNKDEANKEAYSIDAAKEAKSILEKIMGDVSKSSATKQIIIGSTSGWYYIFYMQYFIVSLNIKISINLKKCLSDIRYFLYQ